MNELTWLFIMLIIAFLLLILLSRALKKIVKTMLALIDNVRTSTRMTAKATKATDTYLATVDFDITESITKLFSHEMADSPIFTIEFQNLVDQLANVRDPDIKSHLVTIVDMLKGMELIFDRNTTHYLYTKILLAKFLSGVNLNLVNCAFIANSEYGLRYIHDYVVELAVVSDISENIEHQGIKNALAQLINNMERFHWLRVAAHTRDENCDNNLYEIFLSIKHNVQKYYDLYSYGIMNTETERLPHVIFDDIRKINRLIDEKLANILNSTDTNKIPIALRKELTR